MSENIFAIKEEYKDTIVGFNGSGLPLGQRSGSDLQMLAQMAEHNPSFRKYFVEYPDPAIREEHKVETFLAKTDPVLDNQTSPEGTAEETNLQKPATDIIDPEEKIIE